MNVLYAAPAFAITSNSLNWDGKLRLPAPCTEKANFHSKLVFRTTAHQMCYSKVTLIFIFIQGGLLCQKKSMLKDQIL